MLVTVLVTAGAVDVTVVVCVVLEATLIAPAAPSS